MISNDSTQSNTSDKKVNSNSSNKQKRKESKMKVNIVKFDAADFNSTEDEMPDGGNVKHKGVPFTQVCNEVAQHIHNMPALAVWTYLSTMPPQWKVNKHQIMKNFQISIVTYKKIIKFLKDCRLIEYEQNKDENGRFLASDIVVDNGSSFIKQCTHENCSRERKLNKIENTAGIDSILPEEKPVHRWYRKPITGDTDHRKIIQHINNIDLRNKKTTTTEETVHTHEKHSCGSSSSSLDIDPLREYGFTDLHKNQMNKIDLPKEKIQQSINAYVLALKDKSSQPKNPVKYFMGILRKGDEYAYTPTPVSNDKEKKKARQEAMERHRDSLINAAVDPKYGNLSEIPNS